MAGESIVLCKHVLSVLLNNLQLQLGYKFRILQVVYQASYLF